MRVWAAPYGHVVSRRRLLRRGVTADQIEALLRRGDLWPLYPGVYAVGRRDVPDHGRAWAAILATRGHGPVQHRRALARRSAAALLGAGEVPPRPEIVVVGAVLDVSGIDIRRTRRLEPDEVRVDALGLPCTDWARTTVDLAGVLSRRELDQHLDRSDRARLVDLPAVDRALDRARGRRGTGVLRDALDLYREVPDAVFLSRLERLAHRVLVPAGIPRPEVNGRVDLPGGRSVRVDLLLRDHLLAIELDGRDHARGDQFRVDRWRDRELQKLGYRVLRFTWADVVQAPAVVIADVRRLLLPGV